MKISLCMIVKNEEDSIRKSIESLKRIVDEIIVVDTGSSDNTVAIAKELGAEIFQFEWVDDFSKAKNYALSKVSKKSDWIIFIDADEYYDEASARSIKEYIKQAEKIKCEFIQGKLINVDKDDNNRIINMSKNIRIFKNRSYIYYEGRIHEHIEMKYGYKRIADTELKLFHTGYSKEVVKKKNKAERNLKLLYKELQEKPEDLNTKFFIAEALLLDKRYEESLNFFDEIINSDDGIVDGKIGGIYERSYYYKLYLLRYISKYSKEILEFYNKCIEKYSYYPDYDEIFGVYCYERQKYNSALECFYRCFDKIKNYDSVIESMAIGNKDKIQVNIINCLILLNRKIESVQFIISILKEEKYNIRLLEILLNILSESESDSAIYDFLSEIYDYNNIEDKLFIIDVCKKINANLAELFFSKLTTNEKALYEKKFNGILEEECSETKIKKIGKEVNRLVKEGIELSVNNKEDALKYFKKAYSLLDNDRLKQNNRYAYVPYIAMLYHFKEYEDIEVLSQEALSLYTNEAVGQIDLYYYLGITEIELNKYRNTIKYLEQYFKLIKKAENGTITNDNSESCYSLNLHQNAYYNLAKAYSFVGDKKIFLKNLYKIDDLNYIKIRLMEIIELFLNQKYYDELLKYYDDVLKIKFNMDSNLFIRIIDSKKDIIINFDEFKEKINKHFRLTDYVYDEFEDCKKQVKATIKELIDKKDIFNAESIIKEYEDIVSGDPEIVELKNKLILLKN